MPKSGKPFMRLLRDNRAATAVEYGLICALIVVALIASLRSVASTTITMWNDVSANVVDATGG